MSIFDGWDKGADRVIDGSGKAGLPAPSIVRTAKVACIDGRDVERLGTLPIGNRLEVSRQLRTSLATALRAEERAP